MDSTAIILIVIVLIVLIAGFFLINRRPSTGGSASAGAPPQGRPSPSTSRSRAPSPAQDKESTATHPAVPSPQPVDRGGKGLFEDQLPRGGGYSSPEPMSPPLAESGYGAPPPAPPPLQSAPAPSPVLPPPVPAPKPASQSEIPADDVRFTVFHPKEVLVDRWYTLLTYAHIDAALPIVQADAARFKGEMGDTPRQTQSSTPAHLSRGTEMTILPQMDGVEFNPERIVFKWVEDMHRAEFRMKAAEPLAGLAGNGTISILVGPIIVATVKFGMLFGDEDTTLRLKDVAPAQATASIYKAEKIFISYSHKDTAVATACRAVYKALGYDVLIDVDKLRSGEMWNEALLRLIDQADIFQLFWSQNSSQSQFCRKEWQHALEQENLKGNNFIRPVYWEQPLVPPPDELEPLHFAYVPLPKSSVDENVH